MDARPSLTGNQLFCIREALGETQDQFAKRLFLYQVRIFRLEQRKSSELKARDANDILRIAAENGIAVPSRDEADEKRRQFDAEKQTAKAVA